MVLVLCSYGSAENGSVQEPTQNQIQNRPKTDHSDHPYFRRTGQRRGSCSMIDTATYYGGGGASVLYSAGWSRGVSRRHNILF